MSRANKTHRVIQVLETQEEIGAFLGTEDQCYDWLDDHAEEFVESVFYVEGIE